MAPKTAKTKKATEAGEAIKKGRGKAKNLETEQEIEDISEKIAPIADKKKRGKKAVIDAGNGVEGNGKAEETAPPAKRGRKKAVEELPAEEENPESNEEISGDDASANAEDNESVDTNGDIEPVKAPSSRGRKKQPKKETVEKVQAKPGRGKKGKQEPEAEEEVEEKPKPTGRGKGRKPLPKAQEEDEPEEEEKELPKPKGRGRKKAPAKAAKEKTPESDQDVEEIDDDDETIEDIKKKEAKGRKPAKKEAKEDVPEVDDDEEAPAKKRKVNKKEEKGKGDSKNDDVADEEVSESKPKGRRGQKKAVETSVDDDDTDLTSKRRRKPADEKAPGDKKPPAKNKASTNYEAIDFSNGAKNAQGKDWNFKIASWNVDGIRAWMGKGGMDYLKYEKPDILCLQETKCATDKLPVELSEVPGYHAYWLCSDKDGYAGVNIYTTQLAMNVQYGLQNKELDDEGRIITAEYEQFYLISTYVPNAGRKLVTLPKRLQWNEEFRKFVKELDKKKPVIICGDMNVSHKEIDLTNPKTNKKNAGFTDEERAGMTDLLGDGFVDTFRHLYPDKTGAYTFWTYMMNCRAKNVGWRLDYFIVSERLLPAVCDSVIRDQVYGSDHCPISLFLHLKGADKPKESLE